MREQPALPGLQDHQAPTQGPLISTPFPSIKSLEVITAES